MEKIEMTHNEQAAPQGNKWEQFIAAPHEAQNKQIVINEYDPHCKTTQYNVMYGGTLFQILNPPEEYNQHDYDDDDQEYEFDNTILNANGEMENINKEDEDEE